MVFVEREHSSLPLPCPIVEQSSGDSIRQPLWLQAHALSVRTVPAQCILYQLDHATWQSVCLCHGRPARSAYCTLLSTDRIDHTNVHTVYIHLWTYVWVFGDTQLPGSVFSSACRPLVLSVIHEPSAWASAVSDVCQTGPHLSHPVQLLIVSSSACRGCRECACHASRSVRGLPIHIGPSWHEEHG